MKKPIIVLACIFMLVLHVSVNAQVKIGNNSNTIDANSLLELESTNKGFLPPRVALNDASLVAPLTGTVTSGMLVYSTGGTLPDGYYYWNGTSWRLVATSGLNAVAKSATITLTKTETLVLASGDITLTLPVVTSSDNGLAITVKNIGTHTDLVTVVGSGSATIDNKANSKLTRWYGKTYIAYGGNWVEKEKQESTDDLLDVSPLGSWTTIQEAIEFLEEHMTGPSVIRLSGGSFEIDQTQVIDLDFPLTIQGLSFSKATIEASGLTGPMFRCLTETYFKMLAFDATTQPGYGNTSGNDAIQFEGEEEYFEIKDCSFDGFNKALVAETNIEIWIFEVDINNAKNAGIELAAGIKTGVTLKVSEVDFTGCAKGIHLLSGPDAIVSIINSTFYNASGGVGITYIPATFTTFSSMFITNNAWNNIGTFATGFDFSLTTGRDSKAFIQSNAGDPDRNPNCYINVINSAATSSISATWAKVNYNHAVATTSASMWTVANASGDVNKITYQPTNRRSGWFIISGNISNGSNNRNVSLGIVKNGVSTTRLGETTIRMASSGQPYPFSIVIYLSDIGPNDYYELYANDAGGASTMTLLDMQWYAETK